MRAMWAFVATALLLGSGCTKQDWIDRTLVTVDVTGTWYGSPGGSTLAHPGEFSLDLKQEGATVQGFLQSKTGSGTAGPIGGPISGTVAGDVFRFTDTRGVMAGELTVHGDEMSGTVQVGGSRPITLRRVDPSSRR